MSKVLRTERTPGGEGLGDWGAGSSHACLGTGAGGAGVPMGGDQRAMVAQAIPEMTLLI